MRQINFVTKGPAGLVEAINGIISTLNGIKVQPGKGVAITPTGKGWIVSVKKP